MILLALVLAAQAAPPAIVTNKNGALRDVVPSASYCLNATGSGWEPCQNPTPAATPTTAPAAAIPLTGNGQTLAAGTCSSPVVVSASGEYGLAYVIGGTSPALALQSLGPDASTWITGFTASATGAQVLPVFAGAAGVSLRWCNTGTNPATITASLSR